MSTQEKWTRKATEKNRERELEEKERRRERKKGQAVRVLASVAGEPPPGMPGERVAEKTPPRAHAGKQLILARS